MNTSDLTSLLEAIRTGQTSVAQAVRDLRGLDDAALGFARLDQKRGLRTGSPEVVFGPGKTTDQVVEIAGKILDASGTVLITRVDEAQVQALTAAHSDAVVHAKARVVEVDRRDNRPSVGLVAVVAAGTADRPVAEEAIVTARWMGSHVEAIHDVGVAGVHRVLSHEEILSRARAIVVCAGMDGALPSVVGGLFAAPVIAVPTSVGYGSSFGGVAALLAMLNSCSAGVTVVNIDNGFGAGAAAARINRSALSDGSVEDLSVACSRVESLEQELTQLLGQAEQLSATPEFPADPVTAREGNEE